MTELNVLSRSEHSDVCGCFAGRQSSKKVPEVWNATRPYYPL